MKIEEKIKKKEKKEKPVNIDALLKWNKFECGDQSIYYWKHDDNRIAIRSGKQNIVWLNLQILQFLEAELFMKQVGANP